jgi:hypothetical protein
MRCYRCDAVFSGHVDLLGDDVPKDGDFTSCARCGFPQVFCDGVTSTRPCSKSELLEMKSMKRRFTN